jgi:uncharacterized protein (TIGR00296 family)
MTFELSNKEGELIVRLARKAVDEYLKTGKCIAAPEDTPKKLKEPSGVFVTINKIERGQEHLRGCIGYPYPTDPLVTAIIQSAISAATQDPRFNPLSRSELDKVVFEVSVLTPPQRIEVKNQKDCAKVEIGKDGLIIERGIYKGLLLPQVPVEWNWGQEEFLCQCCVKAGLPADNWLLEGTKVYKFQAIIFEEQEPNGEVKRKELSGK